MINPADWPVPAKYVGVIFIITILTGIGDAATGFHVLGEINPVATKSWTLVEMDRRKAVRDQQLADASDKVTKQIKALSDQIVDMDELILRWRVEDYPAKIGNAKTNLVTLEAAVLSPGLAFAVKQNLDQQIDDTKIQIAVLEASLKTDSCTLINLHRFTPIVCP